MATPSPSSTGPALGVFYAVAAAGCFSTAGVIVRRIDLPAWDISFWRSVLLIAAIAPLLVWQRRAMWQDVRNAGPTLLYSALALSGSGWPVLRKNARMIAAAPSTAMPSATASARRCIRGDER